MDIDSYMARNGASCVRLEELTGRARRSPAQLSPAELEELVALYQRTSAQLSHVRVRYGDAALTARLTRLVAAANALVYGRRTKSLRVLVDFFTATFPAAVYRNRRFVWISVALFVIPAVLIWVWLANDPAALEASAPAPVRADYVQNRFEQYYEPSPVFFTEVTTNNIRVTFTVFGMGIVAPFLGPVAVLLLNGGLFGQVAAWMTEAGDTGRFLGLVLPHGMLELSAIIVAGGASLALGWAVVSPGDRRRGDALREEGRRLVVVILGCSVMLIVSGILEGFITGSGLPVWARVGVGALGWVAFVLYIRVMGRSAVADGITGAIGERRRRWEDELTLDDLVLETEPEVATPAIDATP